MNMLTRPSMPETIDKAIAIETSHIKRYRKWSLRFRTFAPELAVILQAQADEMEEHRELLTQYAGKSMYETVAFHEANREDDTISDRHFFIVDTRSAKDALAKAIVLKKEARDFYKECTINELGDSSLINLYSNLFTSKEIHTQILVEAKDRFRARGCSTEQAEALG
ncbi:hypothetical protein GCM10011348_39970 [Marinobacterium nitratireducens]|uniref:Rubrerythrin diiron-binding domain-containing protein n=1 Tax=Marinobacterium nitratireducens TaxID=518897 RepID=A0A917ZPQ0_9GAMM|nr:hypothetical protein [Marinobacterium nitratireducens]GGO87241.1 hypothetical protein GCM10011348_39970 [Marinobacterium nitratireducens]